MKTLVLIAHPNIDESRINKAWKEQLETVEGVTVHALYEKYSNGQIDVEKEQELLLKHDRIVFQFPLYWYSSPSLLKEWQDQVLTYGWAYGSTGKKLHGKRFMIATSAGGPSEAYQAGGYNHYSMSELLKPFQAMANLTGMIYEAPFTLHGVRVLSDNEIQQSAEALVERIQSKS